MPFTEDLTPFYADFGEAVTINAVAVTGIFDNITADAFGVAPNARATLRVPATTAVALGDSVVRGAVTYTVAGVDYADFSEAEYLVALK
jgi:UDP-3-O-[3-hydroxymyristoyl] glucosamine N-acyltransferase